MTDEPRRESGPGTGLSHGAADAAHPHAPQRAAFWRTLDELADDPAFRDRLCNEFPTEIEAISDPVARRAFLKLMGASLALAGVTVCTR